MKTVIMSLVMLVSCTFTSAAFASKTAAANYDFFADNSYRGDDGECVQSIFHISQVSDLLLISEHLMEVSEAIKLTQQQVAQFTKLANRSWGTSVVVEVKFGSKMIKINGDSCGRMMCDSVEIKDGATTTYLEQPIHAFNGIKCAPKAAE